jgi:regulator of cell morphogenesis and NO signaling
MTIATTTTVGEIAAEMPGTTREFEKLGIDYCCGGSRTLGEACAAANISIDEALARLEKSSASSQAGTNLDLQKQDWQKQLLADLIGHITSTHHAFVRSESPRIEALAAKVVGVHGKNHPELIEVQKVFSALAAELSVHLMKEEQILFPYISRMEENVLAGEAAPPAMFGTVLNPVRMMMQEHDGAGDSLRSLRTVTKDYTVPADACISYRTLYQALQEYEADLHQHIHLENNILFPRAVAMEAKR